jgi:mRNA-degrading endonuclease RelE of RelBE toxin-antitoxin system
MSHTLWISKQAEKTIKSLDQSTIRRIHARLKELAQSPFDSRISSQVEMGEGERKSRVGDWRIFFEVNEPTSTIHIIAIRPRGKAYQKGR